MRHSVLIPAYNEEKTIGRVVKSCLAHCPRVLVVDDASEDDTAIAAADAGAVVLCHATNAGRGAALATGFDYLRNTQVKGVVTLDGNGQHSPADLPRFFDLAETGKVDVIVGCRMRNTRNMPSLRLCVNRVTSQMMSVLSGQRVRDLQCGYRWIRNDVWEVVKVGSRRDDAETEFLINAGLQGFKIAEIPVSTAYRRDKKERHPLWEALRSFRLMIKYIF